VSENVERLRHGYAAWNRRDWEALFSMIDPVLSRREPGDRRVDAPAGHVPGSMATTLYDSAEGG